MCAIRCCKGTATGAKFRVKGDLRHFPFKDPRQGDFRITADVRDVTYAFVPPSATKGTVSWPALTAAVRRAGFRAQRHAGQGRGGPLRRRARACRSRPTRRSPTSGHHRGRHAVRCAGRWPRPLGVVNGSPISAMTGHALAKATRHRQCRRAAAAGTAARDPGQVESAGQRDAGRQRHAASSPDSPLLSRARGTVTFTERGFSLVGAQARALGGDVRRGRRQPRVSAGAAASRSRPSWCAPRARPRPKACARRRELGFLSRLARDATGGAAYNVTLSFRRGTPEIPRHHQPAGPGAEPARAAGQDGRGRAAAALRKRAGARVAGRRRDRSLQDQLTLDIGRLASVVYVRDLSGRRAAGDPRRHRRRAGAGRVGAAARARRDGQHQSGATSTSTPGKRCSAAPPAKARRRRRAARRLRGSRQRRHGLPAHGASRVRAQGTRRWKAATLHNVVVGGSRDGQLWRANVDADELNGYVEYRQSAGAGAGRLHARLARLPIAARRPTRRRVPARRAARQPAGARHRGRRLRAARQEAGPAGDRRGQPRCGRWRAKAACASGA